MPVSNHQDAILLCRDLSDNELQVVPDWLRNFTSLTELKLSDNAIMTIDPALDHPACLAYTDAYINEAFFPPTVLRL